MKLLMILVTPIIIFAHEHTMTASEHNSIHGYNQKPMIKTQRKWEMHKVHKVREEKAIKIAKEQTKEDVQKIKLTHTGNIIFYKVYTQSHYLEINAMNSSIIEKKKK